jgi:hypothetical protein
MLQSNIVLCFHERMKTFLTTTRIPCWMPVMREAHMTGKGFYRLNQGNNISESRSTG